MQEVVTEGTAKSLSWRLKAGISNIAGKTGTSNQLKDSWFIGFDKQYLIVVWLGRDDNKPSGYSGSSGALPIYAAIKNHLDQ
jgi:penicillin-binding protein 1B